MAPLIVESAVHAESIDVKALEESFEWEEDPLVFIFNNEIPGKVKMHTRSLNLDDWVKIDKTYPAQMKLRRKLLETHYEKVFCTNVDEGCKLAKQELFEMLVDHLPKRFPNYYEARKGGIYNKILKEFISSSPNDDMDPLIRCGELTQEDWCVLEYKEEHDAYVMTAGILYFPMRWSLLDKFNQPMVGIHKPVHGFLKHLLTKVHNLFKAMSPSAPLWRGNWAIFNDLDGPLDLYTPTGHEERNAENKEFVYKGDDVTGKLLTFRAEYQTLRKLPKSGAIIFSIRTYQRYLEEFKTFPLSDSKGLIKAIETLDQDFYVYKGAEFWKDAAITYLKNIIQERLSRKKKAVKNQTDLTKWLLPVAGVAGVFVIASILIHRSKSS